MRKQYENIAHLLIVYIKEAHPEDEWQMDSNVDGEIVHRQPKSDAERVALARSFVRDMNVESPVLVDDIQNTASICYAAWPERLYVIGTNGVIEYKGGMGPMDFKTDELAAFIESTYAAGP